MTRVEFFVPGTPRPQGSKRHVGRGILIESSKAVGPWRERVALAAHEAMKAQGQALFAGPVRVDLHFILPRPKTAPKKVKVHAVKRPDIDKLSRAVLDAITSVMISDDSQVVELFAGKWLTWPEVFGAGTPIGCTITVTEVRH